VELDCHFFVYGTEMGWSVCCLVAAPPWTEYIESTLSCKFIFFHFFALYKTNQPSSCWAKNGGR